jgi:hypothetical protein
MGPSIRRGGKALVLLAGLGLFAASCATRQPLRGQRVTGLDEKLSTFSYIEDGDLVTLVVSTKPARDRDGQPYMPLEIAVANNGLRRLTLTRESFVLVDREGRHYPMATTRELIAGYGLLDFDRNLAEIEGIVFNRFAANPRFPSNFSPTHSAEISTSNLVRDLVALPKHGYLIDFIYFPAPASGIRDQPFELFVSSPDLADPVFVKFEVL